MKNDFNLFAVYKSENSKYGIGAFKHHIIIIVLLIIAILLSTAAINFVTIMTKNKTNTIIEELNSEKFNTVKQDFDAAKNAYDNVVQYNRILEDSQKTFDDSRFITDELINKITSCIPSDTTISNFKVISTDALIACSSINSDSVDIACQALKQTGLFSIVKYSSITWNSERARYEYTINCTFAEVVKK